MENWEKEVNKLELIRVKLNVNFNELQKITGINRSHLSKFFSCKNVPTLKMFMYVKSVLEKLETEYKDPIINNNIEKCNCDCDCTIDSQGIFRRGKIKCVKSKKEHKF